MNSLGHYQAPLSIDFILFHPNKRQFATISAKAGEIAVWTWDQTYHCSRSLNWIWPVPKSSPPLAKGARQLPQVRDDYLVNQNLFVAFHPGGKYIAVVGPTSALELRDLNDGHVMQTFGSPGQFSCCAFTADGNRLVAGGWVALRHWGDKAVSRTALFDTSSGTLMSTFWHGETAMAMHPEGNLIAQVRNDQGGSLVRFALLDDQVWGSPLVLDRPFGIAGIRFSPDGKKLALFAIDGLIAFEVYQFPSLKYLTGRYFHPPGDFAPYDILFCDPVFSGSGEQLLVPLPGGRIREFDALSGQKLQTWQLMAQTLPFLAIRYDLGVLLSATREGDLDFWAVHQVLPTHFETGKSTVRAFMESAGKIEPADDVQQFKFVESPPMPAELEELGDGRGQSL